MKKLFGCALIVLLFSVPSFAKNTQTITLAGKASVGATQLPAGQYEVSWTGSGNNVQVTFKQEGASHPATSTVSARLVQQKNDHVGLSMDSQGGATVIDSVQLSHFTLVLSPAPGSGE
jgi:hypothetical protein